MTDDPQSDRDSLLQEAIRRLQARQARLGHLFETHRHSEEDKPTQAVDRSSNGLPENGYVVSPVLGTPIKRRPASSAVAGLLLGSLFLSAYRSEERRGGIAFGEPIFISL